MGNVIHLAQAAEVEPEEPRLTPCEERLIALRLRWRELGRMIAADKLETFIRLVEGVMALGQTQQGHLPAPPLAPIAFTRRVPLGVGDELHPVSVPIDRSERDGEPHDELQVGGVQAPHSVEEGVEGDAGGVAIDGDDQAPPAGVRGGLE